MKVFSRVINGFLIVCASYAMVVLTPYYPYIFTSNVFALCHGVTGAAIHYAHDLSGAPQSWFQFMESIQLALINIEIFQLTETSLYGMGHSLFIIPLFHRALQMSTAKITAVTIIDTTIENNTEEEEEEGEEDYEEEISIIEPLEEGVDIRGLIPYHEAQQLSMMAYIGNVMSLMFLAVHKENLTLGATAAAGIFLKFLSYYYVTEENRYEDFSWLGEAIYCLLSVKIIENLRR